METLLRILELIRSRNVEVTVTYEAASDAFLFSLSKRDIPIKTSVCFMVAKTEFDYRVSAADYIDFLVKENVDRLDRLTAGMDKIE